MIFQEFSSAQIGAAGITVKVASRAFTISAFNMLGGSLGRFEYSHNLHRLFAYATVYC